MSRLATLCGFVGYFAQLNHGAILTPDNPSTTFASISLVSDDDNTVFDNSGTNVYRCDSDADYSDFCVELQVDNDCSGRQTIEIEVHADSETGDTDILALFAAETSSGEYSYLSYLNDYDGGVNNVVGTTAGVFTAPQCGGDTLFTYTGDIVNDFFTGSSSGGDMRRAIADGDGNNYEELSQQRVSGTPPIRYAFVNDLLTDTIETAFETDIVTQVGCNYDTSFPVDLSPSDHYTFLFGSDAGVIQFSSFEVTSTCDDGSCSCDSLPVRCRVSGDPHFTTFDNTRHHYQGGGADGSYYDYVTECRDSNGDLQDNLPFNIAALQKVCNGPYTCVREVFVELDDGSTVSYPSNGGTPTDGNGNDARGTFSFSFNGGTATYTVSTQNFEIEFPTASGDTARLTFGYKGSALNIRTCNCLLGQLCGICGAYNNDGFDDFTRCDDGEMIDNTGSSSFRGMTDDQWQNTLDFGDSCCRTDLPGSACPETDPGDTPLPDEDCLDDAFPLCLDTWDLFCTTCDQLLDEAEFTADCVIDVCAAAGNDIGGCEGYDCADPTWVETSLDKCAVDCDPDGDLGTVAPSEEPTAEPLVP